MEASETMMAEPTGQLAQSVTRGARKALRWRLFSRSCFVARGNFTGDRLARTDGLSPAKWTSIFGIAHLERTLRPLTKTGSFTTLEKERSHYSSMYGKIVDATGTTYQSISANISGLTATTTYHFRIVANNSSGTTYGSDRTFTTTP